MEAARRSRMRQHSMREFGTDAGKYARGDGWYLGWDPERVQMVMWEGEKVVVSGL